MQDYAANGQPLPLITPVAQPFFDAAREQKLIMQHCPRDGFFFYPRARCPHCLASDWCWRPVRPTGHIHSFTIDHVGQDPAQRHRVPFTIALVDLDDGPRMIGTIAGSPADDIHIGQAVLVAFELLDGQPVTCFTTR